ncbi:MAG: hypothetical protein KBT47_01935, partial [Armatimonadetes bacterium]|nr:hypothetical protein [Candidatus Hippobium faecium]
VYMRIHPPLSQYYIQAYPSLNLASFPVFSNPAKGIIDPDEVWHKKLPNICFAFEEEPCIADIERTRFRRIDGSAPVYVGEYVFDGLKYTFTYYSDNYEPQKQDTVCVECKIENLGLVEYKAVVRMKPGFVPFDKYYGNHYRSYKWDASKFPQDRNCELTDNNVFLENRKFAKILNTDMNYFLEDKFVSSNTDNRVVDSINPIINFTCEQTVNQILSEVNNCIKFSKTLKPKETCYFKFNTISNFDCQDTELINNALDNILSVDTVIEKYSRLTENRTNIKFSEFGIEDTFKSNINNIYQLCIDFSDIPYIYPTQGGIGERHYMWLWEAYFMLEPMIRLGHKDLVRGALEYIFYMQDSPCKPDGKFTDLDGAIGTTGPRWINTTGTAISFACKYYNITHDEEFLSKYYNNIIEAGKWIIRQLNSTKIKIGEETKTDTYKKPEPWGNWDISVKQETGLDLGRLDKVPYYGLMPYGRSNDDDFGHGVAFTDSYTYRGLANLTELLKTKQDPLYEEFNKELNEYKENIARALEITQSREGNIPRLVPTPDTKVGPDFENIAGCTNLIYNQAVDVNSRVIKDYISYYENNRIFEYFTGKVNDNTIYTGCTELYLQSFYIPAREYKKAWECLNMAFRFGMTKDNIVQERFCLTDPLYTPWQPNGSGSGRILTMIINAFYYETDTEIFLFGGFPYEWLIENGVSKITDLYTEKGKVSVQAVAENGKIKVSLTGDYDKNKKIVLQDE